MGHVKKIVIAEDQTLVRQGLRSLLESEKKLKVVAEAGDGIEAIRCVEKHKPDLVLMDLAMPKMSGLSALKDIKNRYPDTKIIALTLHSSEEYILEAFKSGADGYCLKKDSHGELLSAIKSIYSGKSYISPSISSKVLEGYLEGRKKIKKKTSWETLTQREKEVLKLVGEGYSSIEIGDILCISSKTVDKHRSNIMNKINLHSAAALAAYAIEKGLVTK
ncbi:MAG: response regulator transcription factor [Thermodesulfobacteriota bacterium]|nr:response regulator transcription factor [Thermodesulfobacteriota bacterium]